MTFSIPRNLTTRIHRARFYLDTHEKDERELVKKHLPPESTVLELGACLGVVSAVINRCLSNRHAHVAVEANPQLLPILEENRQRNDCQFEIASGMVSKTSDGTFYIDDCIVVSGPVQESERRIKVPVFSIEDLQTRYGLEFDTLFMDIQGGELALLEEHVGLLPGFKLIILELHPHLMGDQAAERCRAILAESRHNCVEKSGLIEVWQRTD
ncbi:MAG: FkbM family methyltransferase [Gammaproteobacteria bacterium]